MKLVFSYNVEKIRNIKEIWELVNKKIKLVRATLSNLIRTKKNLSTKTRNENGPTITATQLNKYLQIKENCFSILCRTVDFPKKWIRQNQRRALKKSNQTN